MNKSVSLREFGYNFLSPMCSEYFFYLKSHIEKLKPTHLMFLAREGFFFEKAYKALVDQGLMTEVNFDYVNVSRTFLFRITITDKETWRWSLSHSFSGSLADLFVGRFGFTFRQVEKIFSKEELESDWELPAKQPELETLLERHLDDLSKMVTPSRIAYVQYLRSFGLSPESLPLMIDVGYSGTIQKILTHLMRFDSQGVYFITTSKGTHDISGCSATMFPVFKDGVKMGDGYTMLDRSLLIEALLTAPQSQFVDIQKPAAEAHHAFDFFYGRKAYTQRNFHELEEVFAGAIEGVLDHHRTNTRFSVAEIEYLFDKFAHHKSFYPHATWPLFDLDDAISGHGNINPLQLFRI